MAAKHIEKYDLICVGGGIMSMTLALICKLIEPDMKIAIFERLEGLGKESSGAWNNAGTGHSAFCELNYTPETAEGNIDISKAVKVCKQFEKSRQFWAYLAEKGYISRPSDFVNAVPHHSWVKGEDNVRFLKQRFETIKDHFLFRGITYTEDVEEMAKWFPLIMKNRPQDHIMAATRMEEGVEVNFGVLTQLFADILKRDFGLDIFFEHEVVDIDPRKEIDWFAIVKNLQTGDKIHCDAEHVFIGAGGGALPLLQTVEIEEKEGYGGFPVSGQWLICKNEEIIQQHWAKVYSKAEVGSPPMSTPHLDTRFIDGKRELLFGPFAGFSMKFLKEGSQLDLMKSITFDNIPSMWGAFWHNMPLTRYLIEQVTMSHSDRMEQLRQFVLDAKDEDWKLLEAGQRVQIIKKDAAEGGVLRFGTEVVSNPDGKITALLGASPGASTAVAVMLEVVKKAFPELLEKENVKALMDEMIPYWDDKEISPDAFQAMRVSCGEKLGLYP